MTCSQRRSLKNQKKLVETQPGISLQQSDNLHIEIVKGFGRNGFQHATSIIDGSEASLNGCPFIMKTYKHFQK
jgi:hypothetical protein